MPNIAPMDAVADAVAAHFAAAVPDLKAIRGWPERGDDLDLDGADGTGAPYRAALSVSVSPRYTTARQIPTRAKATPNGSKVDVLYRLALLTGNLQLDLWAPYRATRDEFSDLINSASAQLPQRSYLRLASTGFFGRAGYYDRPSDVTLTDVSNSDNDDGVSSGEWRKTWTAVAVTDLVLLMTHNSIDTLRLDLTTCLSGILITESVSLTP